MLAPPATTDDFVRPAVTGAPPPRPASSLTTPFQYGRLLVRPKLSYRYLHTDGLKSRPGFDSETAVQTVSPGVVAEFGPNWRFDYFAAQTIYSDSAFDDTLNHFANLNAVVAYGEWSLQFLQTFSVSSEPLVETGRQTDQLSWGSTLNSSYRLNNKFVLTTSVSHNARETMTELIPDTRQWIGAERLMYQFTQRAEMGVSVSAGYVSVKPGPD
jgi:hypothetical protein